MSGCVYLYPDGIACGYPESDIVHLPGMPLDAGHQYQAAPPPVPTLTAERHPGEPHVFRMTCERCGEPGYVNMSIVGPDERVTIEPVEVKS